MKSIYDIIAEGQKNGKTNAEINAELKAAGYQTAFGDKEGNAYLDSAIGSPEPCTVENGKLTSCKAVPNQDIVIYEGAMYHVDTDGVTLIEMPDEEAPWWFTEEYQSWGMPDWHDELAKYIPDKNMMHRPEYANQKVVKGKIRYRYDANGDATFEPVSMFDYEKDHGRNQ